MQLHGGTLVKILSESTPRETGRSVPSENIQATSEPGIDRKSIGENPDFKRKPGTRQEMFRRKYKSKDCTPYKEN